MTEAQRGVGIRPDDIMIALIGLAWFTRLALTSRTIHIPSTPVNSPIIILSFIMILATLNIIVARWQRSRGLLEAKWLLPAQPWPADQDPSRGLLMLGVSC